MQELKPSIEEKIRSSFARQAFMSSVNAVLDQVEHGRTIISAPVGDGFTQQHGYSHAGLIFSIGDSAAGYAALSVMPEDREVVTSEIKIHLLSPAIGESLVARGRVVKPGRRLVVVTSEVFAVQNGTEKQIALLTGTMVPVPV